MPTNRDLSLKDKHLIEYWGDSMRRALAERLARRSLEEAV
jgi:hypothetical protein